jgi:DNA-binding LacI/PurR family transcriptional regulator
MPVTQDDIAKHLGISQVLVSYALRGNPRVNAQTRERILATAEDLGYDSRANNGARSMVARRHGKRLRSGVIAVVFPSETTVELRSIPYYVPILDGMQDEAAARGLEVCLCPMRSNEVPRIIRERNVDGVVVLARGLIPPDLDIPRVDLTCMSLVAHSVAPDDREGGRLATRHLLELGHRRIAYIGVVAAAGLPNELRRQGYYDAMREFGVEVPDEWIAEAEFVRPSCLSTADEPGCGNCAACSGWDLLLAQNGGRGVQNMPPFTALVCYNDHVAMGAIRQALKMGIEVPRDLSIVGFDDVSSQYHFRPALTSVSSPMNEMGADAVRIIQGIVEDGAERETEFRHHVLPVSLVTRDSTIRLVPEEANS